MYSDDTITCLERATVLIVDDNAAVRGILRTILHAMGAKTVYEAADVRAAMSHLKHDAIDLMIVDWKMHPVDGLTLVRWVRNPDKGNNAKLPILMLTCYADAARVREARDAGVTEFMVKPFSPESIYQHIRAIMHQPRRFVSHSSYFGPDRRRTSKEHQGQNQRSGSALEQKTG